ncbi:MULTISPECIES: glycosyltransferase family 2 protein [Robiginitalea]|uniref:glycosyltransferase family 2 protein n=1 Tax=Robiginitalea TaxID=252306 RepID=UPI00234998FD|nr:MULTISPECIES: glycosyltransferase family 2 protein [unclassified Robiginitalea]MDC6352823.1 glycosyltransferase family 2 protein [Robiginitalea sp. PM2]MDC6374011.1 glycosyltransferase family 2 protein [Robiginitalea sp. SP8]
MKNNPQSVPRQATASTPLTPKISLIIPAQNEAGSIGKVLDDVPEGVSEKIVVDNGSTDDTAAVARKHGATVLHEPRKGYGYACLKGMNYLGETSKPPDIVVFMDGDYSDYPEELPKVVAPILEDRYDLVIGARSKALREPGSMTPQQVFGNWLATFLMRLLFGARFTDLGPFRAIRYEALKRLKMEDKTYGWTVEMQLKAIRHKLAYTEVPVRYKKRIGVSKVSGTVKGSIFAGVKILGWIFKYSIR